jgi:hypothetical protein
MEPPSEPGTAAAAAQLLQLPPELFQHVWGFLLDQPLDWDPPEAASNKHQHALRCTCRGARQASDELIDETSVDLSSNGGGWLASLQTGGGGWAGQGGCVRDVCAALAHATG